MKKYFLLLSTLCIATNALAFTCLPRYQGLPFSYAFDSGDMGFGGMIYCNYQSGQSPGLIKKAAYRPGTYRESGPYWSQDVSDYTCRKSAADCTFIKPNTIKTYLNN